MYRYRRGFGDLATSEALYVASKAVNPSVQTIMYCSQGRWNWLTSETCWGLPLATWQQLAGPLNVGTSMAAPPGAPSGALLTTPPASGEQANQVISDLVNQQAAGQQTIDASGVQSGPLDVAASAAVDTADALANAANALNPANWSIPWGTIAAVSVVAVLGLAALGAGSPRKYGR